MTRPRVPWAGRRLVRHLHHAFQPERLGEIARHAEVERFDGVGFGREPREDDDRHLGTLPDLTDHREPVHAGHPEVRDQQVEVFGSQAIDRGGAVGDGFDFALFFERLRDEVAHGLFVVDHEHSWALGGFAFQPGVAQDSAVGGQPRLDVAPAITILVADAIGRDLSVLDEAIDGPSSEVEILEDFFRRQILFVGHRRRHPRAASGAFGTLGGGSVPRHTSPISSMR